ncbi:hypothetical protein HanRHA438_Chr01g0019791 [Helianthus annuus]|nr:hypothetical protein HanRHA438_Chr01g0019791 [Helianthus annuus]
MVLGIGGRIRWWLLDVVVTVEIRNHGNMESMVETEIDIWWQW